MNQNPNRQQQQTPFPFATYVTAKENGNTKIEKYGDHYHVIIRNFEPETKQELPPTTATFIKSDVANITERIESNVLNFLNS